MKVTLCKSFLFEPKLPFFPKPNQTVNEGHIHSHIVWKHGIWCFGIHWLFSNLHRLCRFQQKKLQKHLVRVRERPIFWLNKTVLVATNMLWCSEVSSQTPPPVAACVAGNWCHSYKSWNPVWYSCHRLGNVYCHHFIGYEGCKHSCFYDLCEDC